MKKIFYLGIIGLISISLTACSGKSIATVNDVDITKEQYKKTTTILSVTNDYLNGKTFDDMNKSLDKKGKKDLENMLLSFMIDNELLYQKAKDKGFSPSEAEINSKYEELSEEITSNPSYKKELDKAGVDKDYLLKEISRDLTIEKYRKDFVDKLNISEQEIQDYYKNNKNEFSIPEVDASHILVSTLDKEKKPVNDAEKEKLKEKADKVFTELENGADFEELAKRYSDDKATGKNGGGLGYFTKDSKNAEFTKHVFNLEKGKTSNVFETNYGYHIVRVNDKKNKQLSFEDSRSMIRNKIIDEKFLNHLNSLEKNADIKK
ncbi:MAG: peptidylprolyl isomerase [Clostridioides difficile]|nr:peptidylprolyl isomerase [Clostridioides sp.]MBS5788264.1 peptidylprolyl isomerase [Clostridioides difficile]